MTRIAGRVAAAELLATRYEGATMAFLGGSAATGAETAHSDLDLTVVYPRMSNVIRESYFYKGWPVETTSLDREGLARRIALGPATGNCGFAALIALAAVLPEASEGSRAIQDQARAVIAAGPAPLTPTDHQAVRYGLTYTLHKLAHATEHDRVLIGATMLTRLVNYWLRSRGKWGASNTYIGRRIREEEPEMSPRLHAAFTAMHAGDLAPLGALVDEILAPFGGRLFDGYRDVVPPGERRKEFL